MVDTSVVEADGLGGLEGGRGATWTSFGRSGLSWGVSDRLGGVGVFWDDCCCDARPDSVLRTESRSELL